VKQLTSAQWLRQMADEFDEMRASHRSPHSNTLEMSDEFSRELSAKFREIAAEIEVLTNETKT